MSEDHRMLVVNDEPNIREGIAMFSTYLDFSIRSPAFTSGSK
jgi:hypothetical protein